MPTTLSTSTRHTGTPHPCCRWFRRRPAMAPEQVLTPELPPGTGAHDDEGYTGPATLTVDGTPVEVRVRVEARTEPHDGRVHWVGRVDRNEALSALLGGKAADVLV